MTSILGFLAIAADRTFCVSAGSQLVTSNGSSPMNVYFFVGIEDLMKALGLLDALAIALGTAEHEDISALRQHLPDPFAPVTPCVEANGVSIKTL